MDPPYEMETEYAAALGEIGKGDRSQETGVRMVIAQHSARFDPGDAHGELRRVRVLRQGDNALSFYERA
jgi:hypothetical protein